MSKRRSPMGILMEFDADVSPQDAAFIEAFSREIPKEAQHWLPREGRVWVPERYAGVLRRLLPDDAECMDDGSRKLLRPDRQLELLP